MIAEIIAIGTELTSGQKLDTNSQWLSQQLASVGIPVHRHTTVADGLEELVHLFRQAAARSQLVLITGGLGPTLDDLTREAMAVAAGVELLEDSTSRQQIEQMFAARKREMPERNLVQALFPAGSKPIPNPRGTAPGIWQPLSLPADSGSVHLAAMPGVPAEMKPMFTDFILPRLPAGRNVIRRHLIHCFGAGESAIEEMLGDLTARGRDPEVGITAHQATITLRITAEAASVDECERKILETRTEAEGILGKLVFGHGEIELENIVIGELVRRGLTVSVMERGTTGILSSLLAHADVDRNAFAGGTIEPGGGGVQSVARSGSDPKQVAVDRANCCRDTYGSSFGVAVDEGDVNAEGILQTVVAVTGQDCVLVETVTMLADSSIHRSRTAKVALNLLRHHLADLPR